MGRAATQHQRLFFYEDLVVWQRAMQLGWRVYALSAKLPPDERFGLVTQMRRAATSVPANIAEGNGRRALGDYVRFLNIASGSLNELRTHVLFARGLGYINEIDQHEFDAACGDVRRLLGALIRSLEAIRGTTRDQAPGTRHQQT